MASDQPPAPPSSSSSPSPSPAAVAVPAHYPSSFPQPPPSFTLTESDFRTHDGLRLHKKLFTPLKPPVATITFVHGFGEHVDRYFLWFSLFAAEGYIIQAFDHRGHGRSEGRRGHVPSIDLLVEDVALVVGQADKSIPQFLYGHSMGGGTVLAYLEKYPRTVVGAVITDPLIKLTVVVPAWKIFAARVAAKIYPTLAMGNELKPGLLTHDEAVSRAYVQDPMVFSVITAATGALFLDVGDALIIPNAHKIVDPFILVHGTDDQLTSYHASEQVHRLASSQDKTLVLKEGWFHEPHNEIGKEALFAEILAWLNHRLRVPPPPETAPSSSSSNSENRA